MALLVHVRHKEWSLYRMFLLHVHDLKYNWFRWLLTAISVQWWLLTCTSGVCGSRFRIQHIIFCSMNNVLAEQYGVSGRIVRSLRKKNAKKSSEEKNSNKNEQSACNGNEKMVEAYSDGKKQVRVQKIQKGVAGTLAHLPAIQIIFIFLRTSTKIIQNFQRKRGCCIPLGPP